MTSASDFERPLAESIALMLISTAAHAHGLGSLVDLSELSLRDALVVAAASVGAAQQRAWVIRREFPPQDWSNGKCIDLALQRQRNADLSLLSGVELKWWRRTDESNASNRRRDLFADFLRAAAFGVHCEGRALVALLATPDAWDSTARVKAGSVAQMDHLTNRGARTWKLRGLARKHPIWAAARDIFGSVPVVSGFQSQLLAEAAFRVFDEDAVVARVWGVRKHQNTNFLSESEVTNS